MNTLIRLKKTTPLLFVALALINFGLLTPVKAVDVTDTFYGSQAGQDTTTGTRDSAFGFDALYHNTSGSFNTTSGYQALYVNTTGDYNTANGYLALYSNTTGLATTANGAEALYSNTTGYGNTANGIQALFHNTTGSENTALGYLAGGNLTTGNNNIDISNDGIAAEANTIRIGNSNHTATYIAGINGVDASSGNPVFIDANGQLGTGAAGWIIGGSSGKDGLNLGNKPFDYLPVTGVAVGGGYQTESIAQQPMGSAGILTNFTVVLESDPGNGRGYYVSVRKNGASFATVICLSSGGGSIPKAFTVTTSVAFATSDLIDIAVAGNNNPGNGKAISWRMTFGQ